jgi:hypothetical protein
MEQEDLIFIDLVEQGAIEYAGLNEEGEAIYNFTDKLKDINPDLFDIHQTQLNREVMFLWEQGFITVDLLQDNPDVGLTEKSFDEESLKSLDDIYKTVLKEIKRILSQQ